MNIQTCRDESLQLILGDHPDHPNYSAVVEHLNDCRHCQQRLEDLAARPSWWQNSRRYLQTPVDTTVPDVPAVDTLVIAQLQQSPEVELADVRAFLQPPRHPEMLGRIGRYEVEREIGRGGMGIVLKGFDSELNRPVAIKLLAPYLASSGTARQRFIREGRAAAAVVHEHVIAIYGIETDNSLPAIVMPFVGGVSLQQHIDQHGPLEAVDVVRIGLQVASGLAAAHAQGLVHRDIKPGNIMLENSINRVQITDFGLARAADDANLTRTGVISGTPSFMSPEQALSEAVDQRSDLFSLGSVLYFAATGRLPFRGATPMGVLQQVCNEAPVRPRNANVRIPEQLEAVIEKLLAKSPDDRFSTAADLKQYLSEYLAHLQQPTIQRPPRRIMAPSARRRRRLLLLRTTGWSVVGVLSVAALLTALNPAEPLSGTRNTVSVGSESSGSSPSAETTPPAVRPREVATFAQLDSEISRLRLQIQELEQQEPLSVPCSAELQQARESEIREMTLKITHLETTRSVDAASSVDTELVTMDTEIRLLEQTAAQVLP